MEMTLSFFLNIEVYGDQKCFRFSLLFVRSVFFSTAHAQIKKNTKIYIKFFLTDPFKRMQSVWFILYYLLSRFPFFVFNGKDI